jgi:hypothetical protein
VSWRRVWRALPLAVVLMGCDSAAQYSAVKVTVLVFDDGTGQMSWSISGDHSPEAMVAYGREFARALGLPNPTISSTPGPASFADFPTDSLDVDVSGLLETVEQQLPNAWPSVFVAVCTPNADGRVDGTDMSSEHWGSCATFDRQSSNSPSVHPSARVRFGDHPHPATTWLLVAVFAAIVGLAAAAVTMRSRATWQFLLSWMIGASSVLVCGSVALKSFGASRSGTSFATGQEFDQGMDRWFIDVAGIAGVLAIVVLVAIVPTARGDDHLGVD